VSEWHVVPYPIVGESYPGCNVSPLPTAVERGRGWGFSGHTLGSLAGSCIDAMHYELWALNVGNLICDYDTETEALAMARQLLAGGWSADDLGLALEFDDGEDVDDSLLPPALYGATLAARLAENSDGDEHHPGAIGGSARSMSSVSEVRGRE
jgi:hypothetical protein